MVDRIGQQFGNYRIIRLLGQGGFADTYLGEHIYLKTSAAIKIPRTQLGQGERDDFYTEAGMIARLRHPNIIRVLDFGVDGTSPYLVMEYAPHGTLRQRHRRGTILPIQTIIPYVKQLAAALYYAHEQKLVHRDVKPENMLIGQDDEILLSDFGIAIVAQNTHTQNQQSIAGTVTYMAPEQIRGKPRPASDQYSLAIVVYEWLTGKVPFNGSYPEVAIQHERAEPPSLRTQVPAIPPDVEHVVLTALAKDPHKRFGSVQAFARALEQASLDAFSASRIVLPDPEENRNTYLSHPLTGDRPQPSFPAAVPSQAPQVTPNITPQFTPQAFATPSSPANQQYQPVPQVSQPAPSGAYTPLPTPSPQNPFLPPPPQTSENRRWEASATTGSRAGQVGINEPPLRRRPTAGFIALIGTLVVILIVGSGLFFYVGVYEPGVAHSQATSTAVYHATDTAHVRTTGTALAVKATASAQMATASAQAVTNATVTARTQATAAVVATQSARLAIYTNATQGTPVLSDPLTSADNYGWDDQQYDDGTSCLFNTDGYHDQTTGNTLTTCGARQTNFSNLAYQVQINIMSGHSGGLGFDLDTNDDGYFFRISTDGTYLFQKIAVDTNNNLTQDTLFSGQSSFIKTGNNQTNLLSVVARGQNIYVFINRQYIDSASDTTYTSGAIGVYTDGDASGAVAAFTNAQVWQL